jgi:hypothetical protein
VVFGWARDAEAPDARVELELTLDGRPVGGCTANLVREDLVSAGIGDGRHGFRLELPVALAPGPPHRLMVRAARDGVVLRFAQDLIADVGVELLWDSGSDAQAAPRATEALQGTAGWSFPFQHRAGLERALGMVAPSPQRLAEQVGALRRQHEIAAALGSAYLPVAVPVKAAVYASYLPSGLALGTHSRPAAQLAPLMREHPKLELLDLLPALCDARRYGRVFTRRGASLTWTGAFHGYRAIAKELGKRVEGLEPLPIGWLKLGGLVPTPDRLEREPELEIGSGGTSKLPAAVIVDDGAGDRIARFLAEHFTQTKMIPGGELTAELIERERPLAIIQLLGEDNPLFAA